MRSTLRLLAAFALLAVAACTATSFEIDEWDIRFQRIPSGCELIGFESDTGERGEPVARFECGEEGIVWFSRIAPDEAAGRPREAPTIVAPLTMEWLAPAGDVVYRLEGRSVGADLLQRFAAAIDPMES